MTVSVCDTTAVTQAALLKFDSIICDVAAAAARARVKGVKIARDRLSKTAQPKLSIRYQFKLGHWLEASGELGQVR